MHDNEFSKASLSDFIKLLRHFGDSLKNNSIDDADFTLSYAREIIIWSRHNYKLMDSLTGQPETLQNITSALIGYFYKTADGAITKADDPLRQSEENDQKILLMWRLWPILHRLLVIQMNAEHDSDDYTNKAAELYGIISQAMESKKASELLHGIFDEIFPLPRG